MLAHDFARALDPALLMAESGLEPDPGQARFLRSDARRQLVCCTRQWGKSTTAGALACHTAIYDTGRGDVLLVAPAQRQSSELFKRTKDIYHRLSNVPRIVNESALKMELENGNRIIALPGTESTIRSYTAKAVIVDEAARVPDELIMAVQPMLITTGGKLIAMSSPYGKRGWFYEAWESEDRWERTRVTAEECPRIPAEALEEARLELGEWQFRQEYMCEFVDTDDQFFSSELIEAAMNYEMEPLW